MSAVAENFKSARELLIPLLFIERMLSLISSRQFTFFKAFSEDFRWIKVRGELGGNKPAAFNPCSYIRMPVEVHLWSAGQVRDTKI